MATIKNTRFLIFLILISGFTKVILAAEVDPALKWILDHEGRTANIIVTMVKYDTEYLQSMARNFSYTNEIFHPESPFESEDMTRRKRQAPSSGNNRIATEVANKLRNTRVHTQSEIIQHLHENGYEGLYIGFWISNQIYIERANKQLVSYLENSGDVESIREEVVVGMDASYLTDDYDYDYSIDLQDSTPSIPWGIGRVNADRVWGKGNRGEGVIMGSIDSGVRGSHLALTTNYVGQYGWLDPIHNMPYPYDDNGHGTHTLATAVGGLGFGVAPKARWMACKGCIVNQGSRSCNERYLLACSQFMQCPQNHDGDRDGCSRVPHIINNSWGSPPNAKNIFRGIILAWRAVGIIPVFSQGNLKFNEDGSRRAATPCGQGIQPASNPNVIAVGATDLQNRAPTFLAMGPTADGKIKPDLSAPGVDVKSAWHLSDIAEKVSSGTSMASPHVAGVLALMLTAVKNDGGRTRVFKYADIFKSLTRSAQKTSVDSTGNNCGNVRETVFPNNAYGYGIVDAEAAIRDLFFVPAKTVSQKPPSVTATTNNNRCSFNDSVNALLQFNLFKFVGEIVDCKVAFIKQTFGI